MGVYRFSLVTIWLYPNRQSIFRYRADFWCHGDDILYRLGKCGHFLILFFSLSKKQWNLVSVNALLLLVVGGLSAYAGKVNFVQPKEGKGLTVTLATRD